MSNIFTSRAPRFPTHPASKWLDHSKDHKDEINKLQGMDGDFYHGFNSGVLAAARMFKDHAEINFDTLQKTEPAIKEISRKARSSFQIYLPMSFQL
jgi:hypothetical protein